MTSSKDSNQGPVLQGFFCIERFRGAKTGPNASGVVQSKGNDFWAGKAPRPDLMPAGTRKTAVQGKQATGTHGPSRRGALRPDLLPGMRQPTVKMPGEVAQQRDKAAGVVTSRVPDGRLQLTGPGEPLESRIRGRMEELFGADFSGVRIHQGPAAQSMGALAFTRGESLHFAPGMYDPTTRAGIELLGHELTHVVQQRKGRVSNPYGGGVAIVQDPALEAEADAMGRKAVATIQAMWMYPVGALGVSAVLYGGYELGKWMGWWGGSSGGKWGSASRAIQTIIKKIGSREEWNHLIKDEYKGEPTSCAATMQIIGLWVGGMAKGKVTSVPHPERLGKSEVVRLLTTVLTKPSFMAFQISPNHHFVVIANSDDTVVVIQGYQEAYTVVEWLEGTNGGGIQKDTFIQQMGEYATGDKRLASAAALALFSFNLLSRRVVNDEYSKPSSIQIKLIQYFDL